MYSRLYQRCEGTTRATSSVTKFMPPHSCGYYITKKPLATNIIPSATLNIQYKFPCIDYSNLAQDFQKVVKKENGGDNSLFNPIYWGPAAWKFFETAAFGYPDEPSKDEQQAAGDFFGSLVHMLPCEKCKQHFAQNIKNLPVNVKSRDTLSRWVVDFHNIVNESLGKPLVPYEQVAARYPKEKCKSCSLDNLLNGDESQPVAKQT